MIKTSLLIFIQFLFLFGHAHAQEKLKRIKSTKETLCFLDENEQNCKPFRVKSGYRYNNGFTTPEGTIDRFYQNWFNESDIDYINNKRNFNEKGLLISEEWYDKRDSIINSYEYEYTEFDSIKRIKKFYSRNNKQIEYTDISYDYKKNKQSELRHFSDDPEDFVLDLYSYNNDGFLNKIEHLSEEGLRSTKFLIYNKKNYLVKTIKHYPTIWAKSNHNSYYQKNDSIGSYFTPKERYYNLKNQLIEERFYSEPGYDTESTLSHRKLYKYDKRKLIEIISKSEYSEKYSITAFDYNDMRSKTYESYKYGNINSDFEYEKFFSYDIDENLIKLIIKKPKGIATILFDYKYDNNGNWIERTKKVNDKLYFVWKREITYFD